MDQSTIWDQTRETIAFLQEKVPNFKPELGMVLGSGLGNFGKRIELTATIPYHEIPHFKQTSVVGHAGNLLFGHVEGRQVICQQGRYHYYEGHHIAETVFPIRVMAGLGVKNMIVSNAAGGINTAFKVGDIMMISDHINFQGANALIGDNDDRFGTRFPDMTYAYDPDHRQSMLNVAEKLDIDIRQGVYLAVSGPSYETPAEIRMFRTLGADAVGMSTVNEVITANHSNIKVLGLSCISNAAAGMTAEKLDHSDVAEVINAMSDRFESLILAWIKELPS